MTSAAEHAWQEGAQAQARGEWPTAERWYRIYLDAQPEAPWAWLNLGTIERELGRARSAEACYLKALAHAQDYPEAWKIHNNLARLYLHEGRVDCIEAARHTVRLQPDFAEGWLTLGKALQLARSHAEAIACFEQAARLGDQRYRPSLLSSKRVLCDWRGVAELEAQLLADTAVPNDLLQYFAQLGSSGMQQRRQAEAYAVRYHQPPIYPHGIAHRVSGRRLRLGYLSADFHGHAVALCLAETIENHDRSKFEVVAYSNGIPSGDAMERRLQAAFERFHDISGLDDEAAAQLIHGHGIDILIDLAGYTYRNRAAVMARRPAPIQLHHLGWPGTMGAPFIDYMLVDRIAAAQPAWFTERLLYLDCYQPNDSGKPDPIAPPRSQLGLPEQAIVLCSANNVAKLTPSLLAVWCEILREMPNAVLWLAVGDPAAEANLRDFAHGYGVDSRLIAYRPRPYADHLNAMAAADLALDCFPYGGHATTSDLLWAGVPVLTCRGESFLSRVGASLVSAAGLPELAMSDLREYKDQALALCRQPQRLAQMKAQLIRTRRTSLLFDNRRYTRGLEAALLALTA